MWYAGGETDMKASDFLEEETIEARRCDYEAEDGSCMYDGHCKYQAGKWRDICAAGGEGEEK